MPKTLLITDDALIIRTMIKDILTEAGWTVVGEATNGEEAIELYREMQPDAVTMDVVMPEYNGLHGLQGIIDEDPDAKVLMVTAVDQTSLLKDAIRMGAADFITKPFDRQHLVETLDGMVS